jgi:hypothetical protein
MTPTTCIKIFAIFLLLYANSATVDVTRPRSLPSPSFPVHYIWLYEGQHGFRPGYSCGSLVVTVCQDIVDALDEGVRTDAIVIDFSKAFDLVPHDRLLMKTAETGVDLRVVDG